MLLCLLFYVDNVPFSFLLGYFVQDAGDIILTGHARASWEFLLHHALVKWHAMFSSCFKKKNSIKVVFLFQIRYQMSLLSSATQQKNVNIRLISTV